MKFKLVENRVELNEGPRGQTEAKKLACSLMNYITGEEFNPDEWMLHHEGIEHSNYDIEHLWLMRKSSKYGSSAHSNYHGGNSISDSEYVKLSDYIGRLR